MIPIALPALNALLVRASLRQEVEDGLERGGYFDGELDDCKNSNSRKTVCRRITDYDNADSTTSKQRLSHNNPYCDTSAADAFIKGAKVFAGRTINLVLASALVKAVEEKKKMKAELHLELDQLEDVIFTTGTNNASKFNTGVSTTAENSSREASKGLSDFDNNNDNDSNSSDKSGSGKKVKKSEIEEAQSKIKALEARCETLQGDNLRLLSTITSWSKST